MIAWEPTSAEKPRQYVRYAGDKVTVIDSAKGINVSLPRDTWRRVRNAFLRKYTLSAGMACYGALALLYSSVIPLAPGWGWLLPVNAVLVFFHLCRALWGWHAADQRTVNLIMEFAEEKIARQAKESAA